MIDFEDLLGQMGLTVQSVAGSELAIYCPFHKNTDSPALYVNAITGLWHCFNPSCGAKGDFGELYFEVTGKRLAFVKDVSLDTIQKRLEQEEIKEEELVMDTILVGDHELDKFQYMINRGFYVTTLRHFEVGFSVRQRRVVLPVRNESYKLVGFIGRAITDEQKPKYLYSTGFPRRGLLYNLHNVKQYSSAIVVEGSLDALKIHQAGFPNVVATLGATLSSGQADLLNAYFDELIIFSDNDEAGNASRRAIIDMTARKNHWIAQCPEGFKDAGELTEEQIRESIQNKTNYLEYYFNEITKEKK